MKERNYGLTANQTQFIRLDLLEKSFNYDVDGCEVFVTRSIIHSPQRLFFVASIVSEWIMEGVKYNELRSWLSSAMETFSDQLLKLSRVFFSFLGCNSAFSCFNPIDSSRDYEMLTAANASTLPIMWRFSRRRFALCFYGFALLQTIGWLDGEARQLS